jgi:protein-tyrosine phosphatase
MDESVAFARRVVADGIRTTAATPHLRADHPLVQPGELSERLDELRERLRAERVPLEVVVGGEVDVFWAGRASDEELRLVSYGQMGRVLLLETPYGFLPDVFEDLVADVVGRGFRVMLAHPERNETLQRSPERLDELAREGLLLQVNASSVAPGGPDAGAHRLARRLLRDGLVHVLASDSHSAGPWRPPDLGRGRAAAALYGEAQAHWLVEDVPRALLDGGPIPARPRPPRAGLGRLARRRPR